jgi:hypothetical protein
MAITTTTNVQFRFVSQADFVAKADAGTLIAGSFYCADTIIYLAIDGSNYRMYGGVNIGPAPTDPGDGEEGGWYYDPSTGILKVIVKMKGGPDAGTLQYVNVTESFSSITYGTGVNVGKIYLTRLDGTELELVIPKAETISSDSTDNEFVTAKAVWNFVKQEIGSSSGPMRYKGQLSSVGDITTAFATAPAAGDMWRIGANIPSAAAFGGANLEAGDWIIFKDTLASTAPPFVAATDYTIAHGVENAAVDNLSSTSTVLPLSANQGRILDGKIAAFDDAKIDALTGANGGEVVISNADGSVSESGRTFSIGTLPSAAAADVNKLANEKQVADALASKASGIGTGAADVLLTATADGNMQRTAAVLSTAGAIPAAGIASTSTIPNEAQVRASLDAIAVSATINWLLN